MTVIITNENWYYLYLEDGQGGTITVPPETTVELPEYFLKYENQFIKNIITGTIPTDVIPLGSTVSVYANNKLNGEPFANEFCYLLILFLKLVWFTSTKSLKFNEFHVFSTIRAKIHPFRLIMI